MSAAAVEAVTSSRTSAADDLLHVTCCDPDRAMCGLDVTDHIVTWSDDDECVVYIDLEDGGAPCCATCEYASP